LKLTPDKAPPALVAAAAQRCFSAAAVATAAQAAVWLAVNLRQVAAALATAVAASAEVGSQLRQALKHNNQTQQRLKVTEAAAAA
jgi:hypothetical protein